MKTYEHARAHVAAFHVQHEDPHFSMGESELRSLAALRDAVDVAIAVRVRELVEFEAMSWSAVASSLSPSPAVLQRLYRR